MNKFFTILLVFISASAFCQVGGMSVSPSGSQPDASAGLDVNFMNKGFLMPRLTTVQRNAIANPAAGLVIYNTDCSVFNFNSGTPAAPVWATLNSSNALTAGVSIVASPAGAVCAGTSVTFSATPSQNNLSPSYQWQVNGVNAGTNSATYTTSSLNSGDVVTCILTSSAACVAGSPATSNAITMVVNTVPDITGTTAAGFCSGSAVTLSASANLGTINWYSVSTGGSSLSSGASFTVSGLTSTTTYYVDATANGCSTGSRTAVTATFYPNVPGEPGSISGPVNVYKDSVYTYSISALPNVASYAWALTLGTIVSGQGTTSISVKWGDSSGVGSVSVASTSPCGTSAAQVLLVGIQTFFYTGSQQTFTIPASGVTQVTLTVYGAQGGSVNNNMGGLGGSATGTISVTPGELLYVYVGGIPTNYLGGFNGGGNGVGSYTEGGGGASDVRVGGTGLGNRVIVAGGGGGATFNWVTTGGTGGGTNGGSGYSNNGSNYTGNGGTQNSGGSPETAYNQGTYGTLGQGGNAASANGDDGGGGGGYYGGGGGSAGGGGGGSGYITGLGNGSMQNGVQSGDGLVIISW